MEAVPVRLAVNQRAISAAGGRSILFTGWHDDCDRRLLGGPDFDGPASSDLHGHDMGPTSRHRLYYRTALGAKLRPVREPVRIGLSGRCLNTDIRCRLVC